jgi:hypothetical protein
VARPAWPGVTTLRAAASLTVGFAGSFLIARCGDPMIGIN